MVIHITEKMNKKIKCGTAGIAETEVGAHLRWYANVFTARRAQYIVTTNAASLFSIVSYGRGVTDVNSYLKQFAGSLGEYLIALDMRMIFERVIMPNTGSVTFCKTADRSVLGSMNDMVNMSKIMIDMKDASPWDLTDAINETPFGALKYGIPKEVFKDMPIKG